MNCTYCGAFGASHRDHIIAHAYNCSGKKRHFRNTKTVPSCQECNCLLGDKLLTTVETRAAYLLGVYEKRFEKLINAPKWSDEELEELSSNFQDTIRQSARHAAEARRRLDHLRVVALPCYEVEIKPGKLTKRGYLYTVIYNGETLLANSADPELDAARALLDMGLKGRLITYRGDMPCMELDIEKAAKRRTSTNKLGTPVFALAECSQVAPTAPKQTSASSQTPKTKPRSSHG